MDNYFKELQKNIPDQVASEKSHIDDMAFLVVYADIDCELFCDGESLCQLKTNKVQKVSVPLGNHTLSIESDKNKDFVKHYPVQYTQKGENYIFSIILKQEEDNYLQELGIAKSIEEDFQQKLNEKDEQITRLKTENSKRQKEIENIKNVTASEKDSLSSLINKKDMEIANLKEDFKKEELTIKRTCQQDCERLVSKLKEESSAELKQLSTQLKEKEGEIIELETEISKLRADLNDPYQKACKDLESKHWEEMGKKEKEISEIRAKCQKEIDNCKSKALSDLTNKTIEISEIRVKCQKEIDDCKSKASSDLADKEKEHVSEIDEMRREFQLFKERIKKEIQDRDNEILKLQSEKRNTDGGLFNKLFKK